MFAIHNHIPGVGLHRTSRKRACSRYSVVHLSGAGQNLQIMLKTENRSPESLVPYERNAKVHTPEQIQKIAGAIHRFGFLVPIVVDREGVIVAGHGRREAALSLGLKSVPVVVADHLTDDEIKAARLADNRIAEAPWDESLLRFELQSLKLQDFKLELTGFDGTQLDALLKDIPVPGLPTLKPDVPPAPVETTDLPKLDDSTEKPVMEQMTFTLHRDQANVLREALEMAKPLAEETELNKNSNGNALAFICEQWLAQKTSE